VLVEAKQCTAAVTSETTQCQGLPIAIDEVRPKLETLGFGEPIIQHFSGGECDTPPDSCLLVRVQPQQGLSDNEVATRIVGALGNKFLQRRVEVVGPAVSEELFQDGVIATILAVVIIAIYVAVRFEWQYGISAVIATGHDVLVTAGLFALLGWEFSLTAVAALLTLAGYSVNDTVVVFDRIRENRRRYKKMPLGELINLSTNQTLVRTVMTSITTSISIIPMLLFVGPVLFEFTAAILFGIVVGTFSSIYVAAALLLYLPHPHVREERTAAAASR
jgi:preprotein translocase SecF subunit